MMKIAKIFSFVLYRMQPTMHVHTFLTAQMTGLAANYRILAVGKSILGIK